MPAVSYKENSSYICWYKGERVYPDFIKIQEMLDAKRLERLIKRRTK